MNKIKEFFKNFLGTDIDEENIEDLQGKDFKESEERIKQMEDKFLEQIKTNNVKSIKNMKIESTLKEMRKNLEEKNEKSKDREIGD